MKEATGEANMTIVTVIIIAAVVAIGTPIITRLIGNLDARTNCEQQGLVLDTDGQTCVPANDL